MSNFQPPPTYTLPIDVDEKTGKAQFSPIWLKWFLDLVGILNGLGAGGGVPISSLDPSGGTVDQVIKINAAATGFDFASPSYTPFMLAGRFFGRPDQKISDVRAGSGVTVTLDAEGYIVAVTGATSDTILANQDFARHMPLMPLVQAGTDITLTQNALGPVINSSASGASDQNILANQIFGG